MKKRKLLVPAAMVMCVILLMPSLCSATTSTIETPEIYFTYLDDRTSFRYWYKGDSLKYELRLDKIIERDDEGAILQQIELKETSVEKYRLTEEGTTLKYMFDERPDGGPLVYVNINVDMNYFEIVVGVVGFNLLNEVMLQETTDTGTVEKRLTAEWTYNRVVVQNSEELSTFYIPALNLGVSLFNTMLTVVAIALAALAFLTRRR